MSRSHAFANAVLAYGPIVFSFILMAAIFVASVNPVLFRVLALVLCGLGLSLFVTAKLSVIKQGILVSFGSRQMSTRHRRMYRVGYALMVTGWFLGIGAVLREAILTQVAK